MTLRFIWLSIFIIASSVTLQSQQNSFEIRLEPIVVEGLAGLQSYAFATHEGDWLLIGGRLDGLHQRQPFAAFDYEGYNNQLIVVNPTSGQVWKRDLRSLSQDLQEQLTSSNMQFYQDDDLLLLTGGYGFSPSEDDHITFPFLTTIKVPELIQAIKTESDMTGLFQQVKDSQFEVTGGRLNKLEDVYYLVGGHKFIGRYNPMGADEGPGFIQEYTYAIRKFHISNQMPLQIEKLPESYDEMNLRRRDYNLVPIYNQGKKNLVLYSGVFQETVDIPWLYPVLINESTHIPHENFKQLYNHYHCANLPIYDKKTGSAHTIFFGGIAQFYKDGSTIVQDNDVPFVSTITDVVVQNNSFRETVLDTKMPSYLGAASEFIPAHNMPEYDAGILDGSKVKKETLVGYVYGGIQSKEANIFWINDGSQSEASATIYKVYTKRIKRKKAVKTADPYAQKLFIYPNPEQKIVRLTLEVDNSTPLEVNVFNDKDILVESHTISAETIAPGKNFLSLKNSKVGYGIYRYEFKISDKSVTRKVSWSE